MRGYEFSLTHTFLYEDTGKYTSALIQLAFTCSKLTIETLEQGVKYVQS